MVTFTGVGRCLIDANQAGDANYHAASQVTQTVTIGKGSQSITFTSTPPTNAFYKGPKYVVGDVGGGSHASIVLSSATLPVCTVSGGVVSFVGTGTCTINAKQAGNANYTAAPQQSQTFTVGQATQTITFTSKVPSKPLTGRTYSLKAAGGQSGKPIVFSSGTLSTCTVAGSVVSFVGVGTCTVQANQGGNIDYAPAGQQSQTIAVGHS